MAAVLSPRVAIRAMARGDLDTVFEIESASYPYPWTRGIFQDCLRVGYRCHVLDLDAGVAGYGIVSHSLDEAHLLNLCIHPDQRRNGLANRLLEHVVREAQIAAADRLFLEVRPSNKAAVKLYKHNGFRIIGRRPGYYPARGGREDALVMVLHLDCGRG
ncbi:MULTISPECIES: ribosomal protein S18-alanine N-acetyltransferase [unclassified Wenzhouxiangella]|uniref:ribosomal protein S18-alanine N-acetyltransferase n=1 Tax=unclassified Wenzhouxiangella TaxID=2613841 RepID=UPI000E32AC4C|nr:MULTISPECIES: ribosomal protein S18-alanine N-acetyltransferase [unclassified Wenzhouxiangella]RFF27735.1 ribosomal-protein-alanine N-acetyltransferase [Wenzhouxiangella sp. 15181]RFP69038.1 ribosomal-protein-alanine N-acetyltransferase [Wenzhouxiangella sp. 15190]